VPLARAGFIGCPWNIPFRRLNSHGPRYRYHWMFWPSPAVKSDYRNPWGLWFLVIV